MRVKQLGLAGLSALALGRTGALAPAQAAEPVATYRNPILHADYSDPDVIRVGDSYYMVASTFHSARRLARLRPKARAHRPGLGHGRPNTPSAPQYDPLGPDPADDTGARMPRDERTVGQRYAGGVWAPSIRHHNGLFHVYFATPYEGVFMSTATRPEGPWSAPVAVIAESGLEDPCPFWDDDGQAYLVHGKVGAGPLVLHRMSPDGKSVLPGGRVIVEDAKALPVLEGPKLYKRNGWYYIFAPIGGVETGPQAVLRSRNIWGPYEHRTVLAPGKTAWKGPHQGGWVETPSGQGWFIHFNSAGAYGRIVHLQPVSWKDDWPVMRDPLPGAGTAEPACPPAPEHAPPLSRPHVRGAARLDASGLAAGQRAGFSRCGQGIGWLGAARQEGVSRVTFSSAGEETAGPILPTKALDLRVAVADQTARYSYSLDGGKTFVALGTPAPLRFSWWKGARPALFTYGGAGQAKQGVADFDWVTVKPVITTP